MTLLIDALGINVAPEAKLTIANSAITFVAKANPDDLILELTELDLHDVGNVSKWLISNCQAAHFLIPSIVSLRSM